MRYPTPWNVALAMLWFVPLVSCGYNEREETWLLYAEPADLLPANKYKLVLDTITIASGDPKAPEVPVIGLVASMEIDSRGRLYIGDGLAGRVHIYDRDGEYIRSFGTRGRGPGELLTIRGIAVKGQWVFVWDAASREIEKYSLDGEFEERIAYDASHSGHFLAGDHADRVGILFGGDADLQSSGFIYHEYEPTSFAKSAVGVESAEFYPDDTHHRMVQTVGPGRIAADGDRLYYVTFPYNGYVYEFEKHGSQYDRVDAIYVNAVDHPAMQVLQPSDPLSETATMRGLHSNGESMAIDLASQNRGLGVLPCGGHRCLVSFYSADSREQKRILVDIVNLDRLSVSTRVIEQYSNVPYIDYQVVIRSDLGLIAISTVGDTGPKVVFGRIAVGGT